MKTINTKRKNHKWFLDKCEHCGLERRVQIFKDGIKARPSGPLFEYLIDGEWVHGAPSCNRDK